MRPKHPAATQALSCTPRWFSSVPNPPPLGIRRLVTSSTGLCQLHLFRCQQTVPCCPACLNTHNQHANRPCSAAPPASTPHSQTNMPTDRAPLPRLPQRPTPKPTCQQPHADAHRQADPGNRRALWTRHGRQHAPADRARDCGGRHQPIHDATRLFARRASAGGCCARGCRRLRCAEPRGLCVLGRGRRLGQEVFAGAAVGRSKAGAARSARGGGVSAAAPVAPQDAAARPLVDAAGRLWRRAARGRAGGCAV
eukprot:351479-Chlamydomonas_euryale.AAC.35